MTDIKKVSVVLASYNGIRYIEEQLDSLRTQTMIPDEVIISDDGSTDGTYDFCLKYISEHNLSDWHAFRNEKNLGFKQNFRFALSKCTGDYIFTCDQDDVWMNDKIQIMVSVMNSHPEINLLVSNIEYLYEGGKSKLHMKYVTRNDGSLMQLKLKEFGLMNQRPGCTFCFRRELLEQYKVLDFDYAFHDEMLWRHAIVSDSLYLLNKRLIFWRRHGDNATFASRPKSQYPSISMKIEECDEQSNVYQGFLDHSDALRISPENQKILTDTINFYMRRKKILKTNNMFRIILFVLMNLRYYPTFRRVLSDIYAAVFLRT